MSAFIWSMLPSSLCHSRRSGKQVSITGVRLLASGHRGASSGSPPRIGIHNHLLLCFYAASWCASSSWGIMGHDAGMHLQLHQIADMLVNYFAPTVPNMSPISGGTFTSERPAPGPLAPALWSLPIDLLCSCPEEDGIVTSPGGHVWPLQTQCTT